MTDQSVLLDVWLLLYYLHFCVSAFWCFSVSVFMFYVSVLSLVCVVVCLCVCNVFFSYRCDIYVVWIRTSFYRSKSRLLMTWSRALYKFRPIPRLTRLQLILTGFLKMKYCGKRCLPNAYVLFLLEILQHSSFFLLLLLCRLWSDNSTVIPECLPHWCELRFKQQLVVAEKVTEVKFKSI